MTFHVFFPLAIRLVIGFVTSAKDNTNIPIDSCSINLKEYNKNDPPTNYMFDFVASELAEIVHDFIDVYIYVRLIFSSIR